MSKTLMFSRQVNVILSVNVVTQDGTGLQFSVLPLLSLTWLIMLIWRLRQRWNRFRFNLAMLADDITDRLAIATKVMSIGFNALAWGVGL